MSSESVFNNQAANAARKTVFGIGDGVLVLAAVGLVWGAWFSVPNNSIAIKTRFGAMVGEPYGEGAHLKLPFVEDVHDLSLSPTSWKSEHIDAASSDLQTVTTSLTTNVKIDPLHVADFYRNYRTIDVFAARVLGPSTQETLKAVTSRFTAEQLVTRREQVRDAIITQLKSKLKEGFVLVDQVSVTNFAFSGSFAEAIEKKVTAEQQALQAQNDLQRIRIEGEQTVTKAKAQALAAEAQAAGVRVMAEAIQKQGGADYVKLKAIEKWDGKLPQVSGGNTPFIELNGVGK